MPRYETPDLVNDEIEMHERINIFIKFTSQYTLPLSVRTNLTIKELKALVLEKVGQAGQRNASSEDRAEDLISQDGNPYVSQVNAEWSPRSFDMTPSEIVGMPFHSVRPGNIRFIFAGKFLDIEDKTLRDYKLEDGDAIHCLVRENAQLDYDSVVQSGIRRNANNTEDSVPRGFDQLREAGIPEDDIQEMRVQFYNARPNVLRRLQNGEITLREVHEMEEEWMQETNAEAAASSQTSQRTIYEFEEIGTNFSLMIGVIFGYLFGLIMLLWIFDGSLSFKFKYGILVGLCSNFLLTIAGSFFA